MPNIFKAFSRAKAEPYEMPPVEELIVTEPPKAEEAELPSLDEEEPFIPIGEEAPAPEEAEEPQPEEVSEEENPISYAQIQAEQIMADAHREAEELLAQARDKAALESETVFAQAQERGYQEGYVQGMADRKSVV